MTLEVPWSSAHSTQFILISEICSWLIYTSPRRRNKKIQCRSFTLKWWLFRRLYLLQVMTPQGSLGKWLRVKKPTLIEGSGSPGFLRWMIFSLFFPPQPGGSGDWWEDRRAEGGSQATEVSPQTWASIQGKANTEVSLASASLPPGGVWLSTSPEQAWDTNP